MKGKEIKVELSEDWLTAKEEYDLWLKQRQSLDLVLYDHLERGLKCHCNRFESNSYTGNCVNCGYPQTISYNASK